MDGLEEKYNGAVFKKNRSEEVIKTGKVAIRVDLTLTLLKAIVGFMSGSIAIILDAVNNMSDLAASIVTIMGTKLANKSPDREHPFGHGRLEYLSAMIVSVMILYVGVMSLWESIKKVFTKDVPSYNVPMLIIVAIAVTGKFLLGRYMKRRGEKLKSSVLMNSGQDSLLDSLISSTTLVAAIIFLITKVSLEAYLGIIISVFIVKAGIDMLKEAIYSILGERVDIELVRAIKGTICSFEGVYDACDMIFNNYGPNSYMGAVHVEVPDTYTVDDLDRLTREITARAYEEHGVVLYAIGAYPVNTRDKSAIETRDNINNMLKQYKNVLQMHGFYYNEKEKEIRFDIVVSFDEKNKDVLYKEIYSVLIKKYADYKIDIAIDTDFSVS